MEAWPADGVAPPSCHVPAAEQDVRTELQEARAAIAQATEAASTARAQAAAAEARAAAAEAQAVMAHTPASPDADAMSAHAGGGPVPTNPPSNATTNDVPALAVPVISKPAYLARSMSSLERMVSGVGSFVRRASRKVAPEGNEQQKANPPAGVSQAFLEDFMLRVLPQFGIDRNALATPKTREEWLDRLKPQEGVHVINVAKEDKITLSRSTDEDGNKVELVNLGDGLQASKEDVEHVRRLVRLPRCRNDDWILVEAEVDMEDANSKKEIDADTTLRVRVKGGDPNAEWMDFLKARDVALIQTSDIVDFVIKPVTQWKNGTKLVEALETTIIKGKEKATKSERKTYAEHMMEVHPEGCSPKVHREWVERNYFGNAPQDGGNIFVSHAWMDSYLDFSDALTEGVSMGDARYRVKVRREFELGFYRNLLMRWNRFFAQLTPECVFEYILPPDLVRLVPFSIAYRWTRLFGSWRLISDEDYQRMPAIRRGYVWEDLIIRTPGDGPDAGDQRALFEFYNICGCASRHDDNEETAPNRIKFDQIRTRFESRQQDGMEDEERRQQEEDLQEERGLLFFVYEYCVLLPALHLYFIDLGLVFVGMIAWMCFSFIFMLGLMFGGLPAYGIVNMIYYTGIFSELYVRFSTTKHLNKRVSEFRQLGLCDKNRHWIDIFCKNQWVVNSGATQSELEDRVGNVDCLYLICHSWNAPQTLKRMWCQFELRAARVYDVAIVGMICDREIKKLSIHVDRILMKAWPYMLFPILFMTTDNGRIILKQFPRTEEVTALEDSIRNIDARTAEAQYPEDKKTILALIQKGENTTTAAVASGDGESEKDRHEKAIDAHNQSLKECYMRLLHTLLGLHSVVGLQGFFQNGIGYQKTMGYNEIDLPVRGRNGKLGLLGSPSQAFVSTSIILSLFLILCFGIVVYYFDSRREFHLAFFVGVVGSVLGYTFFVLDMIKMEFISTYLFDDQYSRKARRRDLLRHALGEATGTLDSHVDEDPNPNQTNYPFQLPYFYGGLAATIYLIYHYVTHGNI